MWVTLGMKTFCQFLGPTHILFETQIKFAIPSQMKFQFTSYQRDSLVFTHSHNLCILICHRSQSTFHVTSTKNPLTKLSLDTASLWNERASNQAIKQSSNADILQYMQIVTENLSRRYHFDRILCKVCVCGCTMLPLLSTGSCYTVWLVWMKVYQK